MKRLLSIFMAALSLNCMAQGDEAEFDKVNSSKEWSLALDYSGRKDWQKDWFLDGKMATIKNDRDGMHFAAGPEAENHAHHAVLWTKESFEGDIKIEYDYTRTDSATKYVTLLYIQATGDGEGPFTEDIAEWSELRAEPYMRHYFDNMKLLHISYAAFGNDGKGLYYVRARRYPKLKSGNLNDIKLTPSYDMQGYFKSGQCYHITAIKRANKLYFKMESKEDGVELFSWNLTDVDPITHGRVGLRHMFSRSATYKNMKIYTGVF